MATNLYLSQQKNAIRKSIKHKIIAGIDKTELVLIKFSNKEISKKLEWEHSKEFEYNGNMYDVVEKLAGKDSTHFWVWPDAEEDKLNKHLKAIVKIAIGSNPDKKQKQDDSQNFYKNLFNQWQTVSIPVAFHSYKSRGFKHLNHYSNYSSSPLLPPPDYCA